MPTLGAKVVPWYVKAVDDLWPQRIARGGEVWKNSLLGSAYIDVAVNSCACVARLAVVLAFCLAEARAGTRIAMRIATTAMLTRTSMRVNADKLDRCVTAVPDVADLLAGGQAMC